MEKLFPRVSEILSKNGVFYLLVSKENKPGKSVHTFKL